MTNETDSTYSNMFKAYSDFNSLKVRLDTQPLLDQIELFLRGARITIQQAEDGQISTKKAVFGVPKANDEGIQSLLNWVSATINPQTVQGNFPVDRAGHSEKYEEYIEEYHIELCTNIIENAYDWEIPDSEIFGIIQFVMLLVIPFMSRLIDNKERESYGESMRSTETVVNRDKPAIPVLSN